MQVLVVGANGLLGGNVVAAALDRGISVAAGYHSTPPGLDVPSRRVDVTDPDTVSASVREFAPETVINCAAMTDVNGCETNENRAQSVNATGAEHVARAASNADAALVHTSTDYVFDGTRTSPYPEEAGPNPLQVYGETKLAGERHVRDAHPDPVIARLSFVYGRSHSDDKLSGFPAWVCDRARSGDEIPLFTDQYVTPSHAGHTAETLLDLAELDRGGTYHVASRSCMTPYKFGAAVLDAAGFSDPTLRESSTKDLDRDAERPEYTCLDTSKIETTLGRPQPALADDLDRLF